MKDGSEFYLECDRLKSHGRRHLAYCFTECQKKCAAFHEVPHRVVLRLIEKDAGKHAIEYSQYRLF